MLVKGAPAQNWSQGKIVSAPNSVWSMIQAAWQICKRHYGSGVVARVFFYVIASYISRKRNALLQDLGYEVASRLWLQVCERWVWVEHSYARGPFY